MGSDGGARLPLSSPVLEKTAQISVFSEICEDSVGKSEVSEDSTWHAVGALVILINFTAGKGRCQAGCWWRAQTPLAPPPGSAGALGAVQQLPAEPAQRRKKPKLRGSSSPRGQHIHRLFSLLLLPSPSYGQQKIKPEKTAWQRERLHPHTPELQKSGLASWL